MKKPAKRQINFSVTEEEYKLFKEIATSAGYNSVASYAYALAKKHFPLRLADDSITSLYGSHNDPITSRFIHLGLDKSDYIKYQNEILKTERQPSAWEQIKKKLGL